MIKFGRWGKFIGCSQFPDCRHTEQFLEKTGMPLFPIVALNTAEKSWSAAAGKGNDGSSTVAVAIRIVNIPLGTSRKTLTKCPRNHRNIRWSNAQPAELRRVLALRNNLNICILNFIVDLLCRSLHTMLCSEYCTCVDSKGHNR